VLDLKCREKYIPATVIRIIWAKFNLTQRDNINPHSCNSRW
jgi:hypothetical protein